MDRRGTAVRIGLCCAFAGGAAAFTVAACGDDPGPGIEWISLTKLSQVYCEKLTTCGCFGAFVDVEELEGPIVCEPWNIPATIPGGGEYGGEYGDGGDGERLSVQFNRECADRLTDLLEQVDCDGPVLEIPCEQQCKLYFGPRWAGEPCESDRECSGDLICHNGECREPCGLPIVGPGEPCEFARCAAGLECVVTVDDGVSAPAVCGGGSGGAPVGAACMGHADCTTFFCPAGFCAELPGAGSPCIDGRCGPGVVCEQSEANPEGTCVAIAPICVALALLPEAIVGGNDDDYYY